MKCDKKNCTNLSTKFVKVVQILEYEKFEHVCQNCYDELLNDMIPKAKISGYFVYPATKQEYKKFKSKILE